VGDFHHRLLFPHPRQAKFGRLFYNKATMSVEEFQRMRFNSKLSWFIATPFGVEEETAGTKI